jgi:hypothetical protein
MWTTAVLAVLSLTPAQADGLRLTNIRATYGVLGVTRTSTKVLPGDRVVLSFDIEGVQPDDSGKVQYSIGMEVADANGKVRFKQDPKDREAQNSLGGNSLPAFASLQVGMDLPAGDYTVKVTVTDRVARVSQSFARTFTVLDKGFGLVRLATSADADAQVPAPFVGPGQSLWVNFSAVGFGRDANGQPDIEVALRVLDADGRPTMAKPFTGRVNADVPKKAELVPMQFMLDLNRPGKFSVELRATDKLTGKEATLTFPLTVQKPQPVAGE